MRVYNATFAVASLGIGVGLVLSRASDAPPKLLLGAIALVVVAYFGIAPFLFHCPECGFVVADLVQYGRGRRWAIPDRCPNCQHYLGDQKTQAAPKQIEINLGKRPPR